MIQYIFGYEDFFMIFFKFKCENNGVKSFVCIPANKIIYIHENNTTLSLYIKGNHCKAVNASMDDFAKAVHDASTITSKYAVIDV